MNPFSLFDPSDTPLPPEEVRLTGFDAEPYPGGKRVTLKLSFTPFQKPPSVDIQVRNQNDIVVVDVNIIEAGQVETEITAHLPDKDSGGTYVARAEAYYLQLPPEDDLGDPPKPPSSLPVGSRQTTFSIP
jgi:hypothetical protein